MRTGLDTLAQAVNSDREEYHTPGVEYRMEYCVGVRNKNAGIFGLVQPNCKSRVGIYFPESEGRNFQPTHRPDIVPLSDPGIIRYLATDWNVDQRGIVTVGTLVDVGHAKHLYLYKRKECGPLPREAYYNEVCTVGETRQSIDLGPYEKIGDCV